MRPLKFFETNGLKENFLLIGLFTIEHLPVMYILTRDFLFCVVAFRRPVGEDGFDFEIFRDGIEIF